LLTEATQPLRTLSRTAIRRIEDEDVILAALAALSLGIGVTKAQSLSHNAAPQQRTGNQPTQLDEWRLTVL
jgi:hypothetical protein